MIRSCKISTDSASRYPSAIAELLVIMNITRNSLYWCSDTVCLLGYGLKCVCLSVRSPPILVTDSLPAMLKVISLMTTIRASRLAQCGRGAAAWLASLTCAPRDHGCMGRMVMVIIALSLPPQGAQTIVMNGPVCLSTAITRKPRTWLNFTKFFMNLYCLWPWICSPQTALRCVMYLRFCGWRCFHIMGPVD